MPRLIDVGCPDCGLIEEVLQEKPIFVDEDQPSVPCPQCGSTQRKELPPVVQFWLKERKRIKKPVRSLLKRDDQPMPEEIRHILADILFDPCSCGAHAPKEANLMEHEPECHVNNHSFMKNREKQQDLTVEP